MTKLSLWQKQTLLELLPIKDYFALAKKLSDIKIPFFTGIYKFADTALAARYLLQEFQPTNNPYEVYGRNGIDSPDAANNLDQKYGAGNWKDVEMTSADDNPDVPSWFLPFIKKSTA